MLTGFEGEASEQPAISRLAPSRRYAAWVLTLLTLSYTSSFMDRAILSIVQAPIKQEMRLSDTQLGLLGGFAFALLYSVLGLPVARLAERRSRVAIISSALVAWSLATSLCGIARSYVGLFALRMGVSIGEAGAGPPAQSLIADYFPPACRSTAYSIYSLGVASGVLVGSVAGGYIAQHYGWRTAFVIFGAPGVILAIAIIATVREPERGRLEANGRADVTSPGLGDVLSHVSKRRALIHLTVGASLAAFGGYSINAFCAGFLIRNFGVSLTLAGLLLGIICGLSAGVGTIIGGPLTDRLARRNVNWYMWIPAIGLAAAAPIYVAGFLSPSLTTAVGFLIVAPVFHFVYIGPTFAAMHNMAYPRMRATVAALYYLMINIVGLGIGPTLTGFGSDMAASFAFNRAVPTLQYTQTCRAAVDRPLGKFLETNCAHASGFGIRVALALAAATLVWAALHYVIGARHLKRDLVV